MTPPKFQNVITAEDQLREIIGQPTQQVTDKPSDRLDDACAAFIDRSPFILLATTTADGQQDLSPKGDPPGFVAVYDERTLLIPDRSGNRRADTLTNLLANPQIGLFFMVPGEQDTLRVSGTAQIVRDDDLRAGFALDGKPPVFLIAVTVEKVLFHCSKCIVRSKMWNTPDRAERRGEPGLLAESMVNHGSLDRSTQEMQPTIDTDEETRLY